MKMQVNLEGGHTATLLSCYAPTLPASQEEKEEFYEHLNRAIDAVAFKDKLFVLGDKIGPRLLFLTNRKSHTPFRLVPKSWMTLNGRYALYCRKDASFGAHHKNLSEHKSILSMAKM